MSTYIVVGYVSPATIHTAFHDCLLSLILQKGIGGRILVTQGPRIASGRNRVVEQFLNMDKEWLWMVDSDMTFAPDTLERLLACDEPIVGGLCFGLDEDGTVFPTLHKRAGYGMERVTDYEEDSLIEVDATGAACLLVHRDVLEKLNADYDAPFKLFVEGQVMGDREVGEDVAFCLRATEQGFPIHVHTGISIGHIKPLVIDEGVYRAREE